MERLRVIALQKGVFLRSEARDLGYDDKAVARVLRAKVWVRVRHGAYTFTDLWAAADALERHRIRTQAVLRSLHTRVAVSHTSAAVIHGLRLWNADLSRVHVTRLDGGAGRTERDLRHHEGLCLDDDLTEKDGVLLMNPTRAAVETSSLVDVEGAVVVLDSLLHSGLGTHDDIERVCAGMEHWPETRHVRLATRLADPGGHSVGESRTRHLCWVHGLPAPTTQFRVVDEAGVLVGITDLAWPEHGLLGEFDGKVKYGRLLAPGEDPTDVVFREKRREDRLREVTGYRVIRLTWADLSRGAETAGRIRRLMLPAA
jgi:hypothetical protein